MADELCEESEQSARSMSRLWRRAVHRPKQSCMPIRRVSEATPMPRIAAVEPSAPKGRTVALESFTTKAATPVQAKLNQLRALMTGHTDRKEEAQVLALFRSSAPGELNGLVQGLSRDELAALVSDLDDRVIGPDHRTAFLALLSKERVNELSAESRAKVIGALQVGSTDSLDEATIGAVFTATKGEGLTQLKNLIDAGGDHRDLQQLLFHDLDSSTVREAMLTHLAKEAPAKGARVKVFSDIDDTFYVNWKDERFPKKTVYPGVRALYAELDRGAESEPDRAGDLLFLSARPWDRAGASEHFSRSMLHEQGVTQATVLSGDFAHLIGNQSIANKKFENWEQVRALYPEYGSVFVGDSGQGDALFGAQAASTDGGDMRGVLIHNVTDVSDVEKAEFAAKGVYVFDTYVGAATQAFKLGLINRAGLERVMSESKREFDLVPFASSAQREARRVELDADLAQARTVLADH